MNKSRFLLALMSVLLFSAFFTLTGCSGDKNSFGVTNATPASTPIIKPGLLHDFGVVAFYQGGIGIIDGKTQTVSGPLLVGQLGTQGGGRFDVVITPDGKTTLVSNFGDSMVFFIDTSNPANPSVKGGIDIGFFAEDIDITPNGRYALVTDGGFSSTIAVIDVVNQTLVDVYGDSKKSEEPVISLYHNAVAVARDGQTVLTADYFQGKVHSFFLSETGHLTHMCSIDVTNGGTLRPVNVAISPDGITAIAAAVYSRPYDEYGSKGSVLPTTPNLAYPVLVIPAPGVVKLVSYVKPTISQLVKPGMDLTAAQSIAFNSSGTKAYLNCVQAMPNTPQVLGAQALVVAPSNTANTMLVSEEEEPEYPPNVIIALDITEPGIVCDAGTPMEVDFIGTSQLFGVDTLAMDFHTGYLWVSNMTMSGAKNHLVVLDVNTGMVVKTITFAPFIMGDPPEEEETLPVGLYFWNH